MPANHHQKRELAAHDEPSPFVEDRPEYRAVKRNNAIAKPWIWIVVIAIAGIMLFIWTQKPTAPPAQAPPAEAAESSPE